MKATDESPDTQTSTMTEHQIPVSAGPLVLGVDWSNGSQAALLWSADLANDIGAKVILVHAIRPMVATEMAIPPLDYDAYRDNARREIEGWSGVLGDIDHEQRILEDDPASAVLDIADEVDASLVVVGAHARGKWTPPLLGNVTSKILHNSEHPVAVIPTRKRRDPSQQVVIGVDGSPQSERALRWAATSDVTKSKDLYAVSVVPLNPYSAHPYFPDHPLHPENPDRAGRPIFAEQPGAATSSGGDMAAHTAEAIRKMTDLIGRQTGAKISADVFIGSPIERLVEAGEDAYAIVLGRSGHGALAQAILGSTGRAVATHTRVPVIFVP